MHNPNIKIHSVHLPFLKGVGVGGGGFWASNQIFKKGGLDKTSTFREGLLGKRGVTFFRGGRNFQIKNKLKSEIFNGKKSWSEKIFFSVITKNSNWEILIFLGSLKNPTFRGAHKKPTLVTA